MRILDPKNEFGQALLSSANVVQSTKQVEVKTIPADGTYTIPESKGWVLTDCIITVTDEGQSSSVTCQLMPDSSRDKDENIVVIFGQLNGSAVLQLQSTTCSGIKNTKKTV